MRELKGKGERKLQVGPSQVYKSKENVELPIMIGSKVRRIKVSIVQANVPLLFGKDYLKE